jgi:DNA-binding NarL/FixJ family response regulator
MTDKIRVLLVDDHTVLREATAELVDHQPDMQVVGQVGTGEEAIELARARQPDVVIMDIAMPQTNGLDATRCILKEDPNIHIMVLSAHQDADHVIPLLKAGAKSYLPKTVSLDELLDAIRTTGRGETVLPPSVASVVARGLVNRRQPEEECELTPREVEVLHLVGRGYTNQHIGVQLGLSTRTIEAHMTHIFNKLNVNSRTEAALIAQRRGWLNPED